jgi:hypothetical protein
MLRVAIVSGIASLFLAACDKPTQDTSNPVYVTEEEMHSEDIPDYAKSACVGEQRKVKAAGADVATTCKAEGKFFKLYIDDALDIPAGDIQTAAASLDRIADTTAFDGMVGTVENVIKVLGAPAADKLDNGKIAIFVVSELGDAWATAGDPTKAEAVAKFNSDQTLDEDFNLAIANKAIGYAIAVGADADEEPWLLESLGWSASLAAGIYGTDALVDSFLENPNVAWGPGGQQPNAGATLLFGAFLYERFGAEFMTALTADQANGWEAIEAATKAKGKAEDRVELFKEWSLAIWFTDPGTSYGFKFSGLPQAKAIIHKGEPEHSGESEPWGLNYIMLNTGGEVPFTFNAEADAFLVVGVRGEEGVERHDLKPGEVVRLDMTNADTGVAVISSPTKTKWTLSLDEESAKKAEKDMAKAKKKADKEAAKEAKKKGGKKKGADKGEKKGADKGKKKGADKGEKKGADKGKKKGADKGKKKGEEKK